LCRYQFAITLKEPTKKADMLRRAVQDVNVTMSLYSKSVGPTWRSQYDTLLRNVQKALGEEPRGLAALEEGHSPVASPAQGKATTVKN
jgi:hypothetical protein